MYEPEAVDAREADFEEDLFASQSLPAQPDNRRANDSKIDLDSLFSGSGVDKGDERPDDEGDTPLSAPIS